MGRPARAAGALLSIAAAAALLTACSDRPSGTAAAAARPAPSSPAASSVAASSPAPPVSSASPSPTGIGYPLGAAAPGSPPQAVRDTFAVLQATYTEGCGTTDGQCSYFLGRLLTNLDDLQRSMRADPQGPAHFGAPLAWIAAMQKQLGADFTYPNLKAHQKSLLATRDRINAWMQKHPADYR